MQHEQIANYQVEIESIEKQIKFLPQEREESIRILLQKNSQIEKLQNDLDKTNINIRVLGFFKFKERKLLKEEIDLFTKNRKICENEIMDLKNKIDSLVQQEKKLKEKLQIVLQAKDKFQAEEKLRELATQGDQQAQFDVAKLYLQEKNSKQAIEWLKKSADQGHEDAKKLMLQIEEDDEKILSSSHDLTLW